MVEPRLKSKISVAAMLRMGDAAGRPGMVLKRGDPDAGAILILLRGRDGLVVFSQTRAEGGTEAWLRLSGTAPVDQITADALLARQLRFDPDLWALEFEAPDLQAPFKLSVIFT